MIEAVSKTWAKPDSSSPSPVMETTSSARTVPLMARPRPRRVAVTIYGMACGTMVFRKTWDPDAPKTRATSMNVREVSRTPR